MERIFVWKFELIIVFWHFRNDCFQSDESFAWAFSPITVSVLLPFRFEFSLLFEVHWVQIDEVLLHFWCLLFGFFTSIWSFAFITSFWCLTLLAILLSFGLLLWLLFFAFFTTFRGFSDISSRLLVSNSLRLSIRVCGLWSGIIFWFLNWASFTLDSVFRCSISNSSSLGSLLFLFLLSWWFYDFITFASSSSFTISSLFLSRSSFSLWFFLSLNNWLNFFNLFLFITIGC